MVKKIRGEDGKIYKVKKPIYKRVWFWIVLVLVIAVVGGAIGEDENKVKTNTKSKTSEIMEKNTTKTTSSNSIRDEKNNSKTQSTNDNNRQNLVLLDDIIANSSTIGTKLMNYDDYQSLAINGATLEGLVAQYGIPTNVIGASEGDKTMQVAFPTSEDGYSADLIFNYSPSGFGNWKLKEKSIVETTGIRYSKYTYNNND